MANSSPIRSGYPSDWGKVLVGSARMALNSIQWIGAQQAATLTVGVKNWPFGLTGPSTYLGDMPIPNNWAYNGISNSVIGNALPSGIAPSFSLFFAPDKAGSASTTVSYTAQVVGQPGIQDSIDLRGEGVADNENNPALTLDVQITGASQEGDTLKLKPGGIAILAITAKLNAALLPAGIAPVEYVALRISYKTDDSNRAHLLKEKIVSTNNFAAAEYLHYLNPQGPERILAGTKRDHDLIARVGKPVRIQIMAEANAAELAAGYTITLGGHYDPAHPGKWANSHKVFKLLVAGTSASAEPARNWPHIGHASLLGPQGGVQQVQAVDINGGVEVPGKGVLPAGTGFRQMDNVIIGANMEVHFGHQKQAAEKLTVLGYQPNQSSPMNFSYQNPDGSFSPWDGQIPHLGSKGIETLGTTVNFEVFNGPFTRAPGNYTVFVGYRLNDGSVMFNGSAPLQFKVTP